MGNLFPESDKIVKAELWQVAVLTPFQKDLMRESSSPMNHMSVAYSLLKVQ
jgi:hypothetical protein